LSAAALLAALAALLAALILLAWLLFLRIHNCSFVSSLPTTKPRPLSFLRRLVRKRTIRPVESGGVHAANRSSVSGRAGPQRRAIRPPGRASISGDSPEGNRPARRAFGSPSGVGRRIVYASRARRCGGSTDDRSKLYTAR
jgi:hypothetical protein